jgi:carbon-monoxide dehydrogenase medium subunit
MKPASFAYHRAASVDDAIAALSDTGVVARVLAGGQSLVPMLNLRLAPVDKLIDLSRIGALKSVEEQKGHIRYGALTTHAAFEDRRVPDASNGLMPFVGSQIAYRAVRTRGTIGGAVALADPAADWLTVILALEADILVAGAHGRRRIPSAEFAVGPYMTALQDGEIIEAIAVPRRPASERWGHEKVARKTGEYAESMAIALIDRERKTARLVLGAADGAPIVLAAAARAMAAGRTDESLLSVIRAELAATGRDFSATKLLMHSTVAFRAVRKALAK